MPLHRAAEGGNAVVVQILLAKGADVHVLTRRGETRCTLLRRGVPARQFRCCWERARTCAPGHARESRRRTSRQRPETKGSWRFFRRWRRAAQCARRQLWASTRGWARGHGCSGVLIRECFEWFWNTSRMLLRIKVWRGRSGHVGVNTFQKLLLPLHHWLPQSYLTENDYNVVLQKSFPAQIRQLILYISYDEG